MSGLIENLENKVSESWNNHGIFGLCLIPGALVFKARKYVKDYYGITKAKKLKTYAMTTLAESIKIGIYFDIAKTAYEIFKNS